MSKRQKLLARLVSGMSIGQLMDFFDMCWWAKYKHGGNVQNDVIAYLAIGVIPEYVKDILDKVLEEQNGKT